MKRVLILAIVLVLAAVTLAGCYDASSVRDACEGHGGVADVANVAWDFSEDGDAAIVTCKDGYAKGLS